MISVVIPAYNERDSITGTVNAVHDTLKRAKFTRSEIIVVNDGSSDDTGKQAEAAGARVVANPQNMGYGFALKRGINAATHDTIVIIDADGTYPAEDIPRLVKRFRNGFNMVVGARSGKYYWGSSVKAPLRIFLKWLVEFTAGRHIPDVNSGLRVFSKKEITPYFDHLSNTFSFTTTVTLAYMLTQKFVEYVEVDYRERIGDTKVRLLRDSLRVLQQIVEAGLYFNPLKVFLAVSMATLVVAVGSMAVGLALSVVWAAWLGIGLVIVSVVIFALGLLARALNRPRTRFDGQ